MQIALWKLSLTGTVAVEGEKPLRDFTVNPIEKYNVVFPMMAKVAVKGGGKRRLRSQKNGLC